ncbi:alpha-protein kinase 2 isoform X1 [Brachyistius frenatus]|uniref:alpha-protein kinase 2 isoform X1 n=1 Tax=Brachyistius frenatus TaxID=100188 RepID=UPI0037E72FED
MDLSLLCTDEQRRSPPALTDGQTADLDSALPLHSPTVNTLCAHEPGTEMASDLSDTTDKSTLNVSKCLFQEKSSISDSSTSSSSSCNVSQCFPLCSEPPPKEDDDLRVHCCLGSSQPILHRLPHLSHDLFSAQSETLGFYFKQEPESFQAVSSTSEGSMEPSVTELVSGHNSNCERSRAPALSRSSLPQSDSSDSDTLVEPLSDLYIFESDTQSFILSSTVDLAEIKCPEYQPLSQTDTGEANHACDTQVLMCDSADIVTKCHHVTSEERAIQNDESATSQPTGLRPPAADAWEVGSMSVNDVRQGKAEVTGLTPQLQRSNSPNDLWLDACQYLAGEGTNGRDVLNKTSPSVMQGGLSATSDLSFLPGETRGSDYSPDGSEGIGWSGDDTRGWGPPVERWSSVDSWASALSDWAEIIAAPPKDITAAFAEIGAEIDALTQALAEVNTHIETSKEGPETAAQGQSQPPMGVQDQLLKAQSLPESSIHSGRSYLCLEAEGPELCDREGSQSVESLCDSTPATQGGKEPEEFPSRQAACSTRPTPQHSSMGSRGATVASPGGYRVDVMPGSTSSSVAHLDLSQFGGYVKSLDSDIFISNEEDPIILNIVEDTDLDTPAQLVIEEPAEDGLRKVTDERGTLQLGSEAEQEAKRRFGPDLNFLPTHDLTKSRVPGVHTHPGLHINVHARVSFDPLPDLDGARQVAPQWGIPQFIMPLAPLSIGSSLICQASSSLEKDQTCAKRFFNDNRDVSCDHVQRCAVWPTPDGITDKPSLEVDEDLIHKKSDAVDTTEKSSAEELLDTGDAAESFFTARKTIHEEINDLSRELPVFTAVPADHFVISEKNRIAYITLDFHDPFVSWASKPVRQSVKAELNQITSEKMPHKTHKITSEGKARSKKDKSAAQHHGAQAPKKQEVIPHHVSTQQTCKQQETHTAAGENHASEKTPAGIEAKEAKLVIETGVVTEKSTGKPHGKKKKKHGQNTTSVLSAGEPLTEVENGAKPKTTKGRVDMFEAKLGAKSGKAQKDSELSDSAEKKAQQTEAKAPLAEQPPRHTDLKDHQPKKFPSPLNDDVIKRRRLSENKFGKIVGVFESKLPKSDVSTKAKAEELKGDVGATRKKAYSEVVKQKVPPKEDPKVVQPIQAVSVSGDPQSLCLWCQFAAVFSDHTVTWSRDSAVLSEIKRSAGDESRVSLTITNASHKHLGKYQCRLSSSHGSAALDYLLTYEVLSEIVIPPSPKTISSAPVDVGSEEEDVRCSRLMFKEDFLSDQYFGENQPISIITEKVHFGEGMHRRAFRTKMHTGQIPLLLPGHSGVLKVHNAVSYGTNNSDELVQKNFTLAVEVRKECQVQNTAREYINAYTAAAQSIEAFGDVPEIIPIYLVHRPSNDIPYATLEEELIGNFVKYSVKDGKEINLMRCDSEAGQKCCAFQHWVYHKTEGNLLVTDMQGVGMRLTDVGIATCKKGYKGFKGNCATSFIDQFKALHQCNMYCEFLGLKSLQPKAKKPASVPKTKPQPSAAPKKKTFGPTVKGKS